MRLFTPGGGGSGWINVQLYRLKIILRWVTHILWWGQLRNLYTLPPSFATTYTQLGTVESHDCVCVFVYIYTLEIVVREGVSISHHPTYTDIIPCLSRYWEMVDLIW